MVILDQDQGWCGYTRHMVRKDQVSAIIHNEIFYDFIHASGPGGQNVNKVATAVRLRFNVMASPSLSKAVKERFLKIAGRRVNRDGVLVIAAKRYRSQEQNRIDAEQRLLGLLRMAMTGPKRRHPTKPTRSAQASRLETKKRRSRTKYLRTTNTLES